MVAQKVKLIMNPRMMNLYKMEDTFEERKRVCEAIEKEKWDRAVKDMRNRHK